MIDQAIWLVCKGLEYGFTFGLLLMLFGALFGYCVSCIFVFFDHISGRKL